VCEGQRGTVQGNSGIQLCTCTGGGADAWTACADVCGGVEPTDPFVVVVHPGDGETRLPGVDIPFAALASDPQDGKLTGASIVWTDSLSSKPLGTGETFQKALSAGVHVITVTVTDSDGNVATASFTLKIDDQSPTVAIWHPGDKEIRAANVPIPFIGDADDPQDGALSGASMVWRSNLLVMPIGTGTTFDAALPAGTHVITLTATDSDGNTGSDSLTLFIQ
jgi:hypothetical protein